MDRKLRTSDRRDVDVDLLIRQLVERGFYLLGVLPVDTGPQPPATAAHAEPRRLH